MNEKDREYFQEVVDNTFGQFLEVVAKERKMNKDSLLQYANGRVFTGLQAKDIGLIDTLGTFEDAIRITASLAGIEGEPRIIKERRRYSIFERLIGTSVDDITGLKQRLFSEPILQYRFKPSE